MTEDEMAGWGKTISGQHHGRMKEAYEFGAQGMDGDTGAEM